MTDFKTRENTLVSHLRLPLIVLVMFAHSYGAVRPDYSLLWSGWDSYEVLKLLVSQTLAKVAVPLFYVFSGYLFFANVEEWSMEVYRRKMLRRVKTLLLPYLFWNLLMAVKLQSFSLTAFWVFWPEAGLQTDWLGMENRMTAPANMPLWFLRDLMVVSLFTPVIYVLLRRWGTIVMSVLTLFYLSGIAAFAIPGLSAYALFFFCLGAWLSIRHLSLAEFAFRFGKPALLLSLLLAAAMLLSYHTALFSSFMLGFRLAGTVATLRVAQWLLAKYGRRQPQVVCRSSYFVYLAHYVFFFHFIDDALFSLLGSTATWSCCAHYIASPLLKALLLVGAYVCYVNCIREKIKIFFGFS